MAYASQSGRAKVSSSNPRAFGICDRCGFLYNHDNLQWQFDWAGASLINKRILVCNSCLDVPQEQLRAIVLPADPVPIMNPRVENYAKAETDYLTTVEPALIDATTGIPTPQGDALTTVEGTNIVTQPVGANLGLELGSMMPNQGSIKFDIIIPAMSVSSTGTNVITVTCSKAHNLSNDSQISIFGTSIPQIQGFFSVNVVSATTFTYSIVPFITSGSFLTPTTRIATANVGLPYGFVQIPVVGQSGIVGTSSTPYFWVSNSGQPIYFTNNSGSILYWSFP